MQPRCAEETLSETLNNRTDPRLLNITVRLHFWGGFWLKFMFILLHLHVSQRWWSLSYLSTSVNPRLLTVSVKCLFLERDCSDQSRNQGLRVRCALLFYLTSLIMRLLIIWGLLGESRLSPTFQEHLDCTEHGNLRRTEQVFGPRRASGKTELLDVNLRDNGESGQTNVR